MAIPKLSDDGLKRKLKRQMIYYFGQKNYYKDTFLLEKASQDEGGFIDMKEFLTFNKVKAFFTESGFDVATEQERMLRTL
jgi:hypothetical protein